MSTRMLVWGLSATMVLAALLFMAALAIVVVGPLLGEPLQSSWSVTVVPVDVSPLPASGAARLRFDHGMLELLGGDGWLLALKTVNVVVIAALALAVLALLRSLVVDIRDGYPFGDNAARRLRWIGWLLVGWPLWQAMHAALAQIWLFANAGDVAPDTILLHTLAPEPALADAVRVLADVDAGALVAGLVVLVLARAFAYGIAQRRDLDEIV